MKKGAGREEVVNRAFHNVRLSPSKTGVLNNIHLWFHTHSTSVLLINCTQAHRAGSIYSRGEQALFCSPNNVLEWSHTYFFPNATFELISSRFNTCLSWVPTASSSFPWRVGEASFPSWLPSWCFDLQSHQSSIENHKTCSKWSSYIANFIQIC